MEFLHRLSGFLFYVLGASFFAAYFLLQNGMGGDWPLWWMETWDTPLLAVAFLFGGLSLYRSISHGRKGSPLLKTLIALPLILLFLFLLILNYWYHVVELLGITPVS